MGLILILAASIAGDWTYASQWDPAPPRSAPVALAKLDPEPFPAVDTTAYREEARPEVAPVVTVHAEPTPKPRPAKEAAPAPRPPDGWKPDAPPQPSIPVKVTLFDAAGQGWEWPDAAELQVWIEARNQQIRAQAYAPPAVAPPVYGGEACSGGPCQPAGRGLFGRFFRRR